MQNEWDNLGISWQSYAFLICLISMIPAGLALFLYTMDVRWLLMCLPILLFLT